MDNQFRRELIWPKVAQWQPYVFAIGVAGISVFMMGAGTLGVSRRHWDIEFSDAVLTFEYPATAFLMMGLNGICAILAALGGAMYILVVVGSILFGKRREGVAEPAPAATPQPRPEPSAVGSYGTAGTLYVPGTYILVIVFFVTFVLYYFVNWKYLSEVWPLS